MADSLTVPAGPVGGESIGHRLPDAPRRTGNQRCFSFQVHIHEFKAPNMIPRLHKNARNSSIESLTQSTTIGFDTSSSLLSRIGSPRLSWQQWRSGVFDEIAQCLQETRGWGAVHDTVV